MDIIHNIPDVLVQFVVVMLLSLLIGLEQRSYHDESDEEKALLGTDRTFTLIGIFGYLMFILDEKGFTLFITGAVMLSILFGVFYWWKIKSYQAYGVTNILVAFVTYSLGPVVVTQPNWLTLLVVVAVLIMVPMKEFFLKLTSRIEETEFVTLAKFIIIAGIILPVIPKEAEIPVINISAYSLWLTVVVVSSISYFGYLLQKFVFRKSGVIISGILGGVYSSTATTLILSRKSRELKPSSNIYAASLVLATAMMYVRILILMFIFNAQLAVFLLPYFIVLIIVSLLTGFMIYYIKRTDESSPGGISQDKNPLELKIALLFAVLFVLFSFITHYTVVYYGANGLNVLSYMVGFTDIDPFLLNLFQGKYPLEMTFIAKASLQAIISNNILKSVFMTVLADSKTKKIALVGMGIVTVLNFILVLVI